MTKCKMKGWQIEFMKVVFVSNYFNHHQKPFCEAMYRRLGADFRFISTTVMREERRKLGYAQEDFPTYVYLAYENTQCREAACRLINDADVVIAGSAPNDMLAERIRAGKLLLRYAERPYKKKASCIRKAYHFFSWRRKNLFKKKNIYMLCASAYTAEDYASLGMYKKRTYKWGYFPEVKNYDGETLMAEKEPYTLMWCGRFIDWKHPDDAVRLARMLKDHGYDFKLNFVGTGNMEEELHALVKSLDLSDRVNFWGSMPPEQVRRHMEKAGIYLFTSDRQEGWGAVLNESMNSACAVIASHTIGSAPFLIDDGYNGLIYQSGNIDMLFEKVTYLLDHPEEQERLGYRAYSTMQNTWNAEIATERILQLTERMLAGEKSPILFENGPCSKAEKVLKNGRKPS